MALMQEMETVQQEKVAGITNPPAEVPPADVKNSVSGSGGNGATPNNNEVALAGAAPQKKSDHNNRHTGENVRKQEKFPATVRDSDNYPLYATQDTRALRHSLEFREIIPDPYKYLVEKYLNKQQETPAADPVALMLARLDQREQEMRERNKQDKHPDEKFWTSVGLAAGSFNTVQSGFSQTPSNFGIASNADIAKREAKASGTTYSLGVNAGVRISERWVLQGGVHYRSQASDYEVPGVVGSPDFQTFKPASIPELDKLSPSDFASSRVVATVPYTVSSDVRYLSIPVQAGYVLIDRDWGLQLNAGIAADLFLQNTVTAEGQNIEPTKQYRGDSDSPFRPVNFSGLLGTEISYRFGDHYRLSLNPGLRYQLNSLYKDETGVQTIPLAIDLGLRFRYIFN